jgi:hypothetical protein
MSAHLVMADKTDRCERLAGGRLSFRLGSSGQLRLLLAFLDRLNRSFADELY